MHRPRQIERKKVQADNVRLSRHLMQLQEDERRTIASELHDEIGQLLTGLKIMIETRARRGADLGEVAALVQTLQDRVKDLSLNLRPPMLDDLGLVPTLLWHCERVREQTGLQVSFRHHTVDRRLPAEIEIAAFRIVQEALTNVVRHAGVDEASVDLGIAGGELFVRVEDAGSGFDPAALPGTSYGVRGMRQRARQAGGCFEIDTRPGGGTRLLARLPLATGGATLAGA